MAWTTPATYATSEVVSASKLNTHIRDNLAYLKGVLDGTSAQDVTVAGKIKTNIWYTMLAIALGSAPTWDTSAFIWAESGFGSRYDGFAHRFDSGTTRNERMRITSSGEVLGPNGTAALPGWSFLSDTDLGMYRIAADNWALSTGGVKHVEFIRSGGVADVLITGALNVLGSADDVQLYVQGHTTQTSALMRLLTSGAVTRFEVHNTGNMALNSGAGSPSYGTGTGVFNIGDAAAAPSTNPAAGGVLYAVAGSLRWRGSAGTTTTIAPA